MTTILYAVDDSLLYEPYRRCLEGAGHCVVAVDRPLAVLGLGLRWDVAVVDGSALGRGVLTVIDGLEARAKPVVGIGFEDRRVTRPLTAPVAASALTAALDELLASDIDRLVLRPERRVAAANGREVGLTRIEYRLLEALLSRRPGEMSLNEAIEVVWGAVPGTGTPAPLRTHIRNLRLKLAQLGLPDALRSRRGRGYLLTL